MVPPPEPSPPIDSEEFIELRPEHFEEPPASVAVVPEPVSSSAPVLSDSVASAAESSSVVVPEAAAVESVDTGYVTVVAEADHAAEPGDEELATAEEPESTSKEAAPVVEKPEREDLAKKHGVDLHNIFNVNK